MMKPDSMLCATGTAARRKMGVAKTMGMALSLVLLLCTMWGCASGGGGSKVIELSEEERQVLNALEMMQSGATNISNLCVTGIDRTFDPADLNIDISMTYTDTITDEEVSITTRMILDTGECVDDPFGVYAELATSNDYIDIENINAELVGDEATPTP